ncbi:MAG: hypothetical protein LBR26_12495 [Prevotella sp.]|nr:hypothetical protein [Prevotella sp.]
MPPVLLLLKYGDAISLALPELSAYKQTWRQGEKVGKIIILRDISTTNPHSAHIRILEGLKIGNDVSSFNDLHKFWQTKFSIQTLNDEFYRDLQKWFYFAVAQVKLPNQQVDSETTKNFLVRLLARTMFCWFIKEKGLIQPKLLELSDYQGKRYKLTNDTENADFLQSNSYYRGILQNIFFNSLNKKDKRSMKDFKWTKYLNPGFDINWLTAIPFLNGGIFDLISEDTIESLAAK